MHILILTLSTTKLTLSLVSGVNVVATRLWEDERNISEKLLPMTDDLLTSHGLSPEDINDFRIVGDVPEHYTSAQIAHTIAQVFIWGGHAPFPHPIQS